MKVYRHSLESMRRSYYVLFFAMLPLAITETLVVALVAFYSVAFSDQLSGIKATALSAV